MCETINPLNPSHWDARGCAYIPEHKTAETHGKCNHPQCTVEMTQGYDTNVT